MSEILRKFFPEVKPEKGQALTSSELTGIRASTHRHLSNLCASQPKHKHFSLKYTNMIFEVKAKLFTKEDNVKP